MRIFKKILLSILLFAALAVLFPKSAHGFAARGCYYKNYQATWNYVPILTVPLAQNYTNPYGNNAAYYYHTSHDCTGDFPPGPYTIAGRVVSVIVSNAFPAAMISSKLYRDGETLTNNTLSLQDINFIRAGVNGYRVVPIKNSGAPSGTALVNPLDRNIIETTYPQVTLPQSGTYVYKTYQKYYSGSDTPDADGASWYNDSDARGAYKILNPPSGTLACPQAAYAPIPACTAAAVADDNVGTLTLSPFNGAGNCAIALPGGGTVVTGFPYAAAVVIQNRGGTVWTNANGFRLGSQNPAWNLDWGLDRVLMDIDNIWPGDYTSFSFIVTAPSTPNASHAFDWQMRQSTTWFGDVCTAKVNVVNPTGSISGNPNPCIIAEGGTQCTSNLTWSSNMPAADVCVNVGGGEVFFNNQPNGTNISVPWIQGGYNYVFTLRRPGSPACTGAVVASTTVRAITGTLSAAPNPCTIPDGSNQCTSNITWTTSNAPSASVCVNEAIFSNQLNGTNVAAPWIAEGTNYLFTLVTPSGDCKGARLASTTVTANTRPRVNSLQINNANAVSFTGTYGISGKTTLQNASDWLNPMNVTLNGSNGTGATTKYYAGFYTGGLLTDKNTFLSTLRTNINNNKKSGILLGYYIDSVTKNPKWTVQNGNSEVDITGSSAGYAVKDSLNNILYEVYPVTGVASKWKLEFDLNFGAKAMNTAIYAEDGIGQKALNSNIAPLP